MTAPYGRITSICQLRTGFLIHTAPVQMHSLASALSLIYPSSRKLLEVISGTSTQHTESHNYF